MLPRLIRHSGNLLFPGGLILFLALWYSGERQLPVEITRLLPALPWLSLCLGCFISWRFNRSLLFFQLLLFTLAAMLLRSLPHALRDARELTWFLLPLNLCLLPWLKDRGVSRYSSRYPLLLLTQLLLVYAAHHFNSELVSHVLAEPFWTLFRVPNSQLPASVQFSFAVALLVLGWKYWRHVGPLANLSCASHCGRRSVLTNPGRRKKPGCSRS